MIRRTTIYTTATALALAALLAGCAATTPETTASATPDAATVETTHPAPNATTDDATSDAPAETLSEADAHLQYVIEEEKLAHDVYVAMYDEYGRNPFGNILKSEITHQETMVPVLEARGVSDPRTGVAGEFTNPDLQALYDELVAQGLQSWDDAVEVGIIIEETDIEDLDKAIAVETDPAAIEAYEFLRKGSENHLAAFQRMH